MQGPCLLRPGLSPHMGSRVTHSPSLGPTSEEPPAQVTGSGGWNALSSGWKSAQQLHDLFLMAVASRP